jgi:hypothetical protein
VFASVFSFGVVNLADWAESVGVNRHTAYRWFREGTLPVPAERVGRLILVRTAAAADSASQIHHGCTAPDGTPCRLAGRGRIDKQLVCPHTGQVVDRDHNAARNLRDWPDNASCGPVRATAPSVPGPTTTVGTGHGADAGLPGAGGASVRPRPRGARSGEAKTQTPQGDAA